MGDSIVDEFAIPIGTGMRPVDREEMVLNDEMECRLAEFESVRNRGAVEARSAWLG